MPVISAAKTQAKPSMRSTRSSPNWGSQAISYGLLLPSRTA